MHVLCDFAMFCLNFHTLLNPFWTNLLTQCTQLLFSAVFVFQVFRPLKVLQKIRKNQIKNQRHGSFRNHQRSGGGPPPGGQEASWLTGGPPRGPPPPIFSPPGGNP